MKKLSLAAGVLMVFVLFAGCSDNNPAGNDSNLGLVIASIISFQENDGEGGGTYQVVLLENLEPALGADVSVTGPTGTYQLVDSMETGHYNYLFGVTVTPSAYYQFDEEYTVNVSYKGDSFSHKAKAPGNITVTADGSSAQWVYEGDSDQINITGPFSGEVQAGPDINSPFDINATNVYDNGPGTYLISVLVQKQILGAFSGSSIGSSFIIFHQKIVPVEKE
ncbi:MAG: hypothetical protein ACLFP1_09665 [Candidatus Goldiibacteriota bacterium]